MRLRLLLLAVSVAANALLLVHWRRVSAVPLAASRVLNPESSTRSRTGPVDPTAHIDPETWTALAPMGELTDFVARLRAQGYPPAIIRAMVQAQLRERFADRLKPLLAAAAAEPYWRIRFLGGIDGASPRLAMAQRALQREMSEQLQQLLGPDAIDTSNAVAHRRRYGELAPEKITELERINADYSDLRGEINALTRGIVFPEDSEKLVFLEKERRADLARLLTPEELEDHDLRASGTGSHLRYQLSVFEPTEQEFRAIFKIHQSLDTQFGPPETLTAELRRQRTEAEKQIGAQIEAALGAERYADYKRTTDHAWIEANRFVSQMNLPLATTGQLAAIQQDITTRAETLRTDRLLPADQRTAQLTALVDEATNRLMPLLGERFADYKENAGYWLHALRPPPPRPAPAP